MPLLTTQSARGYGFGSLVSGSPASDMELISSTTLTSTQASVSFSGLDTSASAYRHLRIVALVRANTNLSSQSLTIELNGSSAANYNAHSLYSFISTSAVSGSWIYQNVASSSAFAGGAEGATAYPNAFQPTIYEFHDFSQTNKNKYITSINGLINTNTNGSIGWNNIMWNQTSAITSIAIGLGSSFTSGSRFTLYGIK